MMDIRIQRTVPLHRERPAPTKLTATQRLNAKTMQRQGLLFTEIARTLNVPRDLVVRALYWDAIR